MGVYDHSVPGQSQAPVTVLAGTELLNRCVLQNRIVSYAFLGEVPGKQYSKEGVPDATILTKPCSHSVEQRVLLLTSRRRSNPGYGPCLLFPPVLPSKGRNFYCGFLVFLHDCIWGTLRVVTFTIQMGVLNLGSIYLKGL